MLVGKLILIDDAANYFFLVYTLVLECVLTISIESSS